MPYTTLVSTGELALHLTDPGWSVVDCRFDLTQPGGDGQSTTRTDIHFRSGRPGAAGQIQGLLHDVHQFLFVLSVINTVHRRFL